MLETIKKIIKKICTREVIFYGIFGVLTTIVNLLTFYLLTTFVHLNDNVANVIAILVAVLFAYFTNRTLVFNSKATTIIEKSFEFLKFMLGRVFTIIVEIAGCAILFKILAVPNIIIKAGMTIIVIILNFFISEFFSFNNLIK